MKEVKQHQTEGSMWTVLKGRVYNLSPYMKFHPGGMNLILFCSKSQLEQILYLFIFNEIVMI